MTDTKRGQHKQGTYTAWLLGRIGREGSPTWKECRAALLAWLIEYHPHARRWNGRRRSARSQHDQDILRAIGEGLVHITPRRGTVKFLQLTDAGRALLPQPEPPPPAPWAKRREGIAEFKLRNSFS